MSGSHPLPNQWQFAPLDPGGTRAEVHHNGVRVEIILGIDISELTKLEQMLVVQSPVQLRIATLSSLMVFLVKVENFRFDLPFTASIAGHAWRSGLLASLIAPHSPMICVAFVEKGLVHRTFRFLHQPATGRAIAAALKSLPAVMTRVEYENAVARYQARFSPSKLFEMSTVAGGP